MEKLKERNSFVELLRSFWSAEINEEEENNKILESVSEEEKQEYKKAWKNIEKMMNESEEKILGNKKRNDLKVNTKPYKIKQNEKSKKVVEDREIER